MHKLENDLVELAHYIENKGKKKLAEQVRRLATESHDYVLETEVHSHIDDRIDGLIDRLTRIDRALRRVTRGGPERKV